MAIVSLEYYTDEYMGEAIAEEEFPRYEKRAERIILTMIKRDDISVLPPSTQGAVKDAICAEIEYLYEYGMGVATYGKEGGGGFTVGKVSVNEGKNAKGASSMIASGVYMYLEQTGLLNPAVDTAAEPWLWRWF